MPERHPPKDERRFGGEGSNTQRCGDFFARNASHRNDWRFSMPGGIVHCLIHPKYAQLDVYIYNIYHSLPGSEPRRPWFGVVRRADKLDSSCLAHL